MIIKLAYDKRRHEFTITNRNTITGMEIDVTTDRIGAAEVEFANNTENVVEDETTVIWY